MVICNICEILVTVKISEVHSMVGSHKSYINEHIAFNKIRVIGVLFDFLKRVQIYDCL